MQKHITIFTRNPDEFHSHIWPKDYVVSYANPRFFELATDTIDGMWAREQHIIDAYKKLGVPFITLPDAKQDVQKPATPEPKVTALTQADEDVVTVSEIGDETQEEAPEQEAEQAVEPEAQPEAGDAFPSDWRDLSWPKLRGLAASYSDGPVKNKDDAIAIMEEAEKQYS